MVSGGEKGKGKKSEKGWERKGEGVGEKGGRGGREEEEGCAYLSYLGLEGDVAQTVLAVLHGILELAQFRLGVDNDQTT